MGPPNPADLHSLHWSSLTSRVPSWCWNPMHAHTTQPNQPDDGPGMAVHTMLSSYLLNSGEAGRRSSLATEAP